MRDFSASYTFGRHISRNCTPKRSINPNKTIGYGYYGVFLVSAFPVGIARFTCVFPLVLSCSDFATRVWGGRGGIWVGGYGGGEGKGRMGVGAGVGERVGEANRRRKHQGRFITPISPFFVVLVMLSLRRSLLPITFRSLIRPVSWAVGRLGETRWGGRGRRRPLGWPYFGDSRYCLYYRCIAHV